MRILLTGIGGPAGRSLAAQLAARGSWVAGTDIRDVPVPADAFRRGPAVSDPGYLDFLRGLVRQWRIDAVIPSISEELVLLAGNRGSLDAPVLIGDPSAVAIADDKLRTAQRLSEAGVGVPRFASPGSFASAADAVAALGGAIVVKPRVSRGGRGVRVIDGADAHTPETTAFWASLGDEAIVQEFAPGDEYAPVVFRAEDGRILVSAALRKTALKEGRVGNALSVVRADDAAHDDIRAVAEAAVAAVGLTGPADIDVRRRADGTPLVLEINARFGANSAHAPELLDAAVRALQHERALLPS